MINITANGFSKLLGAKETTGVEGLILKIKDLEKRLANIEEQSFYFKKGVESNRRFLKKFKNNYMEIREDVNVNDMDFLNKKVEQLKKDVDEKKPHGFFQAVAYSCMMSDYSYWQEIRRIKRKYGSLPSLN